jgi:hypothetical protein
MTTTAPARVYTLADLLAITPEQIDTTVARVETRARARTERPRRRGQHHPRPTGGRDARGAGAAAAGASLRSPSSSRSGGVMAARCSLAIHLTLSQIPPLQVINLKQCYKHLLALYQSHHGHKSIMLWKQIMY